MQFLGGRGIDTKNIDMDEVQSLIQQISSEEGK